MINAYTSYKGGVGKTTLTLAAACYWLLNTDKDVTLIDCNSMNPDISRVIFNQFHMDKPGICHELNGLPVRWMTTDFKNQDRRFCLIDASMMGPSEVVSLYSGKHTTDDMILIDTNSQISEFSNLPISDPATDVVSEELLWFTWGWAIPKADLALRDIINSLSSIECSVPYRNIIHVFNLYDLFNVKGSFIRRSSKTIEPLNKVIKEITRRHKRAVTKFDYKPEYFTLGHLRPMLMSIREELMMLQHPRDIEIEELPAIWGHHMMNLLDDHPSAVPYNLIVIPTFYEELVMTMERLVMGSPRNIKQIRNLIRPMADYIEKWTDSLRLYGN